MSTTPKLKRGFTLIEMVVTIGIFVIITTLLLANQKKFSTNIEVTNLAYDVALSVRQAQTYGLAVKNSGIGVSNFKSAYGIHFDTATPNTYIVFFDRDIAACGSNTANEYDADMDNDPNCKETSQIYTIKNGFSISDMCNDADCSIVGNKAMDIVFIRPNPEAHMKMYGAVNATPSDARIKIQSEAGKVKMIRILKSGQISVEDPS